MFETGVKRKLQARHFLVGDFGEESVPHSHPYEVELRCRNESLDENGFSTDIAAMEESLEVVLARIDDVLLNDLPYFSDRQPSLEHLCQYLTDDVRRELRARGSSDGSLEIRIWESPTAWASYSE